MPPWDDQRVEQLIGNLLRIGVIVAATVVLAGGALFLVRHGGEPSHQHAFQGMPADLTSPAGIVADTPALEARGVIQLGILLMIAVPVLRVAVSIWSFAAERDWTYVVVTLIVFAVLCFSLFGGAIHQRRSRRETATRRGGFQPPRPGFGNRVSQPQQRTCHCLTDAAIGVADKSVAVRRSTSSAAAKPWGRRGTAWRLPRRLW